jgi:hypothetical protein
LEHSIVKCSHCKNLFSEKNFESHKCGEIPLKECRIIEVAEIYDGSYEGKKLLNGWGIDGILYTFELAPRKAIPLMEPLSRRKVTDLPYGKRTDEDETEP